MSTQNAIFIGHGSPMDILANNAVHFAGALGIKKSLVEVLGENDFTCK
jgi:aromatic ring-opening dioxygenase catalytic subunit (LigB family)